jgi:hypothetical protein
MLLGLLSTKTILPFINQWKNKFHPANWGIFLLFIVFFIFYIFYINEGYKNFILTIQNLCVEFFYEMTIPAYRTKAVWTGVSIPIAGLFVYYMTILFSGILKLSSLYYAYYLFKQRDMMRMSILGGFGLLTLFYGITNYFGTLNASRVYSIVSLIMIIAFSFSIFKIIDLTQNRITGTLIKIISYMLLSILIFSFILYNPMYIIGETYPLRSLEPIDSWTWWNADLPQYAVTNYINMSTSDKNIMSYMLLTNYYFQLVNSSKQINPNTQNKSVMSLSVLHDKFYGKHYYLREQLPSENKFYWDNKIYSNEDYLVYAISKI